MECPGTPRVNDFYQRQYLTANGICWMGALTGLLFRQTPYVNVLGICWGYFRVNDLSNAVCNCKRGMLVHLRVTDSSKALRMRKRNMQDHLWVIDFINLPWFTNPGNSRSKDKVEVLRNDYQRPLIPYKASIKPDLVCE